MHVEVAVADIDDDGHRRPERTDVREILLRSDAEVDAALFDGPQQVRDDILKTRFMDKRLSERKNPSSSDESLDKLQNCRSVSSFGSLVAVAVADGTS